MSGPGDGWGWDDDADAARPVEPVPTGNPYATGEYEAGDPASDWRDDAEGADAVDDDLDGGIDGGEAEAEPWIDAGGEGFDTLEVLDPADDLAGDGFEGDDGFDDAPEAPEEVPRPPAVAPVAPVVRDEWVAEAASGIDDVPPELLGSTSLADHAPPPARRSNRGTRLLVLLVLLGMLAGGIALGRREPEPTSPRVTSPGIDGPEVPPAGTVSTAWYCAAGTASVDGDADETIHVANLSPEPITADVTVDPGGDGEPETARLRIAPYARESLPVREVMTTPLPGVVVEIRGGAAIVEHEIRNGDDLAMSPCADKPSRTWYFASGRTAEGAVQTLELFNPFGDDAVVDIAFLTEGGEQEPQALQGFVVGRHTKVQVPVGDLVARQDRVATVVRTRSGRVIAEQVRTFDGAQDTDGRGLGLSLGSTAPRREWTLPVAAVEPGTSGSVAIANFSLRPASVDVALQLSGDGVLAPETIEVPSRSVVRYDPSGRIPVGTAWTAVVQSQSGKVVAESQLASSGGVATSGAAAAPARRWALAGAPNRASSAVLATNRGSTPITVELRAYVAGDVDSPTSAPAIALEPGKTARFDLDEWGIDPDQVLVVSADGPIVVGRETYQGGLSLALAVPFPG